VGGQFVRRPGRAPGASYRLATLTQEILMTTRTIAILALVIAVVVVLFLVL